MKKENLTKEIFWQNIAEKIIAFRPKSYHNVSINSHYDFIRKNINYLDNYIDLKKALEDKMNQNFIPDNFKTVYDNKKEVYCVFDNKYFSKYITPIINQEMSNIFSKKYENFLSVLKESDLINNYNAKIHEENMKICKAFVLRFQANVCKKFNFNFNLSNLYNVYYEDVEKFTNKCAIILYSYKSTDLDLDIHINLFQENISSIQTKAPLLYSKISTFIAEKKVPQNIKAVKIFGEEKKNIFEDFNYFLNKSYQKSLSMFFAQDVLNKVKELYELGISNNHDYKFIEQSKEEIKNFIDTLNMKYEKIFLKKLEKYYIRNILFYKISENIFKTESHNIFNKRTKDGSYYYGDSTKGEIALMKQLSTYLDYVNIDNENITKEEKNKYIKNMSSNLYNSIHEKKLPIKLYN